jgi:signal transduction histidine kinase
MRSALTKKLRFGAAPIRRGAKRQPIEADELMPHPFVGLRDALQHALAALDRNARLVERSWRGLLRRLAPAGEYNSLVALDLSAVYQHLAVGRLDSESGDELYRLAIGRNARKLVHLGVPEDHAILAVALYLEACTSYVSRPNAVRALLRLTSTTQRFVAAEYAEDRITSLRRLEDQERQRLSGDFHDEVGADLVVLKLYVEMIAAECAAGSASLVGPKLHEALALIEDTIGSARRLTQDLGATPLDPGGLLPTLRTLVRTFSLRTGIDVELEEGAVAASLAASEEIALYRILRGALSNVAKHSQARRVKVTLGGVEDASSMIVEDDGRGFDVRAKASDHGFGFRAMRARIRGVHGRLAIKSRSAGRPGGKSGTRIEVYLPVRNRAVS